MTSIFFSYLGQIQITKYKVLKVCISSTCHWNASHLLFRSAPNHSGRGGITSKYTLLSQSWDICVVKSAAQLRHIGIQLGYATRGWVGSLSIRSASSATRSAHSWVTDVWLHPLILLAVFTRRCNLSRSPLRMFPKTQTKPKDSTLWRTVL